MSVYRIFARAIFQCINRGRDDKYQVSVCVAFFLPLPLFPGFHFNRTSEHIACLNSNRMPYIFVML